MRSVSVCRGGGLCSDYTLMSQVDNSIHAYGYSLEWNSKVTIGGLRWDRYDFDVLSGLSRKLYLAGLGGGCPLSNRNVNDTNKLTVKVHTIVSSLL